MLRGDHIFNAVQGLIKVFHYFVRTYDQDGHRMSPEHACHSVACPIHIDDLAILGEGIGPSEKNIADRSLDHGPETVIKGRLEILNLFLSFSQSSLPWLPSHLTH